MNSQEHLQADVHAATDETLQATLDRVFETADEVEVQHPTQGKIILTRRQFMAHKANMAQKMALNKESPAGRIKLRTQHRRQRQAQVDKFLMQMREAVCIPIDPDSDDEGFKDVDGNAVDVEARTFLPVEQYPVGIDLKAHEIGCLVDESLERAPIRLIEA